MEKAAQDFIERMGRQGEAEGLPRNAGRIAGFLMLEPDARSLEEIAGALQMSRGSASTNARLLERLGVAERVGRPGDRRDYYRATPDFPERIVGVWREKARDMAVVLERTLRELAPEAEPGRSRVDRMLEFYRFLLDELEGLDQRWRAEQLHPGPQSGPGGGE